MNILFRKTKPEDADQLKELAKRVIRYNYIPFMGAEMANAFIDSGMSDKEIDDGLEYCTVMLSDDTIFAFAITNDDLLHLIMVDVPFQSLGFGGKLMAHVENRMFAKHKTIRLQSFKENADTVRFYLKNGWEIAGEEYVKEFDMTMLTFEKSLHGKLSQLNS